MNNVGARVHAPASLIARIVFANPRTLMTRLMLYGSTCKLISAATCLSLVKTDIVTAARSYAGRVTPW